MNRLSMLISKSHENTLYSREERERFTADAIESLLSLERSLFVMWNVLKYKTNTMVTWVDLINRSIELLSMRVPEDWAPGRKVMILDWKKIEAVAFFKNMSELHRYTHGKVVSGRNAYDDTKGAMLIELADDAFWHVCELNKKIPVNSSEFEKRIRHTNKAIACLKKMERHLVSYFNLEKYSNRIMTEWSEMVDKEEKLLYGLRKSDSARFHELLDN